MMRHADHLDCRAVGPGAGNLVDEPFGFAVGQTVMAQYGMDDPSLNHVQMGLTFSALLGGIAGAGLLFSWRRARREQVHAASKSGPRLDGLGHGTPPWLLDLPTVPSGALSPVAVDDFRLERTLRRARTVLFGVVVLVGLALRFVPSDTDTGGGQQGPLLLAFGIALSAAVGIAPLLRLRSRHLAAQSPRLLGGDATVNDTDRVGRRFGNAPLLRPKNRHDRLLHPLVVDGLTGGRHWWVVVQHAAMHGQRQPLQRTTCLVWLPGVHLPRVLVRGRDNVELTTWFAQGLALESWQFGQRLHVLADSQHIREATAILSPQMMEHLLGYLPDGGSLVVRGDLISLVIERPLHQNEVEPMMAFLLGCADRLPSFLLKDSASVAVAQQQTPPQDR